MLNKPRRGTRIGIMLPFQNAVQDVHTPQGKYTIYAVLICALIGAILLKPVTFIVQKLNAAATPQEATDLALIIVVGICAVLVVVVMLKMQAITSALENRRLSAFNARLQNRKGSNNSNG